MARSKRKHGYRHVNRPMQNRIRVRGKRREADETKLTLAYWLLAKQLVEDRTNPRQPTENEVRRAAEQLADDDVKRFGEGA